MNNYLYPPFKIDIAGKFILPQKLSEKRFLYKRNLISWHELRAEEEKEVRKLVDRFKSLRMDVISDVGYFSYEKVILWENFRNSVLNNYAFLTGITNGDIIVKQHLPSPGKVFTLVQNENTWKEKFSSTHEQINEIANQFIRLLQELYFSGCRYVQFDGMFDDFSEEILTLNNIVLNKKPQDLYITFHAATEMLVQLENVDAYFLNYDYAYCDKARLLWFIRKNKSNFGFVLSHHPSEDEFEDWYDCIKEVLQYIPLERLVLCLPDARLLNTTSPKDFDSQWKTIELANKMLKRLISI